MTLFDDTINNYSNIEYSVLSTENSSKNRLFSNFLKKANILKIDEIPCPNLAFLIESNKKEEAVKLLNEYLNEAKYETVILGCTHYPLIINNIKTSKTIINPASFLNLPFERSHLFNGIVFYTSGNVERFKNQIDSYLDLSSFILNDKVIQSNIKEATNSKLSV